MAYTYNHTQYRERTGAKREQTSPRQGTRDHERCSYRRPNSSAVKVLSLLQEV